jgi:hypothetical protein
MDYVCHVFLHAGNVGPAWCTSIAFCTRTPTEVTGCLEQGSTAKEYLLKASDGTTWGINEADMLMNNYVDHTVTVSGDRVHPTAAERNDAQHFLRARFPRGTKLGWRLTGNRLRNWWIPSRLTIQQVRAPVSSGDGFRGFFVAVVNAVRSVHIAPGGTPWFARVLAGPGCIPVVRWCECCGRKLELECEHHVQLRSQSTD